MANIKEIVKIVKEKEVNQKYKEHFQKADDSFKSVI